MLQPLLSIIDRLIKMLEIRVQNRKSRFASVLEPVFNELLLIHGNYIGMFEQLRVFSGDVLSDPSEIERRTRQSKAELLKRRSEFEPVRTKVKALAGALAQQDLEKEERCFVAAVLSYFPSWSAAVPTSAATEMIRYLERVGPEGLDELIENTVQRHRNAWSDVCAEYAVLKIKISTL